MTVFPAYCPRAGDNAPKNQLIQMLSDLQKQMDEQWAEAARDREKATLDREATTCLYNQPVAEIEIFRKLQSTRNQKIEGSHTPLSSPPSTTLATHTKRNQRHDLPEWQLTLLELCVAQDREGSLGGGHRGDRLEIG